MSERESDWELKKDRIIEREGEIDRKKECVRERDRMR